VPSSRPFVPSAHALRFLAAVLVLLGHVLHEAKLLNADGVALVPWAFGVDIFLVISGFIMVHQFGDRFAEPGAAREFLRRRLVRIVPIYWLFTTLMVVAMASMPQFVDRSSLDPIHVAASYLFLPWESPAGEVTPVLVLGWTLNLEMFFYAAFALALRTRSRRAGLTALGVVFALLALAHPLVPQGWPALRFWSQPIILEFVAGLLIALLFRRGLRIPVWLGWSTGMAAIAVLFVLHQVGAPRVLAAGVPAAMLSFAFLLARSRPSEGLADRLLRLGGDASYALYLSHPFTLTAVFVVWRMLGLGQPWLYVIVGAASATVAAVLVHLLVERPLQARLRAALVRRGWLGVRAPSAGPAGPASAADQELKRPERLSSGFAPAEAASARDSQAGLPPPPSRLAAISRDRRR
jgi:exopolysaccharide production protein ExoZ